MANMRITSLQNPTIKRLVRLRHHRREREAEGIILVEGARELTRALNAGFVARELYLCPALFSQETQAGELLVHAHTELSPEAFEKVSGREKPDGVLGIFVAPTPRFPELNKDAVVVVLHGLEKPGNVGAIIRTADAVGAAAVLIVGRGADPYHPSVVRASQGSIWALPVLSLDEQEAFMWLREQGVRLVSLTPEAEHSHWSADWSGKVALLLGTEHEGLPSEWRNQEKDCVSIPMVGRADSLNVSTAAALVLYETLRSRQRNSCEW